MRHLLSLLTIFSLLTSFQNASAQGNCDLIESVTLTVPNGTQTSYVGRVLRLNEPNNTWPPQCTMDIGQWNYMAWVKTAANTGILYKNGVPVYNGVFQNTTYIYNSLDIGSEFFTGFVAFYEGLVDEVRISNVVRTPAEIFAHYNSNLPLTTDANTVGLWHFDQTSGTTVNAAAGVNGNAVSPTWTAGRFGNCIQYNGIDSRVRMQMSLPTSNMTVEFWAKPVATPDQGSIISLHGMNTTTFFISQETTQIDYLWSTGDTATSVTVDPSTMPYVWVTNGSCTDTVWFNGSQIDTVLVTVTDTLLINTTITGINPPNNVNTIRVFPNPALDHVTVDFGNYGLMNGYSFRITNDLGQVVYMSPISQQSVYLNLGQWTGVGLYFVEVLDPMNQTVQVRHIVIQ